MAHRRGRAGPLGSVKSHPRGPPGGEVISSESWEICQMPRSCRSSGQPAKEMFADIEEL